MSRLFGTDGVRGIAITELTCELAMNIGRALAVTLAKDKSDGDMPHVIIGKDTRRSSDVLEAALIAGLASAGAYAELTGIVPTPAVAYFVKKYNADAGVMITASHNTAEFNGIKLFNKDGYKFPDSIEDEIEAFVKNPEAVTSSIKSGKDIGSIGSKRSAMIDYCFDMANLADKTLDGLNILVDCANGCAGVPASEIFANLGADCTIINNSPNGMNINQNCGSTYIEELGKQVRDGGFNLGIAFDGDADRMLAVDDMGRVVDGDKLIAIISMYMKQRGKLQNDTVVVTVMSNMGFHQYMRNNGIKTVSANVGDRYVLEKMRAENLNLGGEQSGHIIFSEYSTTGDGMITAIKLLCMLKDRMVPLSTLISQIPVFPQVLKNVTIAASKKGMWESNPAITAAINEVKAEAGQNARVLVRESGTEPLLRIMIEGKNQAEITQWTDKICAVAERELGS